MSYTQGKQWQSQALTSMKTLHNRKIEVQATAVARPRNHEEPTNSAMQCDYEVCGPLTSCICSLNRPS